MFGCTNRPLPEGLPKFESYHQLRDLVAKIKPFRFQDAVPAGKVRKCSRRSTVRIDNGTIMFSLYKADIAKVSSGYAFLRAAAQTHLTKRYINDLFAGRIIKYCFMYRGALWVKDWADRNFKVPSDGWMQIELEKSYYPYGKNNLNHTITGWEKVLRFVPIKNALRHKLAQYKDFLDYVEGCLYVMGDIKPKTLLETLPYPPSDKAWFKHETVPIYMESDTDEEMRRRRTIFFDAVQDPDRWYGAFVSLVCSLKGNWPFPGHQRRIKDVRREFITMLRYQYPDQLLHRVEVQPCEVAVTYHYDNYVNFCGDMALRNKLTSCQ